MKYVVLYICRTIKILISNWPRKLKFSQFLQACQLFLTFLTKVTHWSRSTSKFYALIGQNLTGEFMRKIYAASWNLFTLTAEADRVLCQLVMFFTVFFHWMYKMKFSCYQSLLLFMASLFIEFLVEKYVACQSRKSDFVFHLAWCVRGLKSLKRYWPYLIVFSASRVVSLSNYCIWCLFKSNFMGLFSLCTFIRFELMIWPSIRFDYKLIEL